MKLFYSKKKKFSRIYDQYVEKIYRFIFLKVNSKELAQDLTSETFLKGWKVYSQNTKSEIQSSNSQNPSFKNNKIENMSAFLYKIARNLVVDYYRGKGKIQAISIDNPNIRIENLKIDLEKEIFLNREIQDTLNLLKNLPDAYQDVIIWHYLDELSISEISEILDKNEGTVRVNLYRALNSLRSLIENEKLGKENQKKC